jgi:hypothetical protein
MSSPPVQDAGSPVAQDKIRVTIADGCPASLDGHFDEPSTGALWIVNPDSAGLDETFVPGKPTEALICRYASLIPGPFLTSPTGPYRVEHGGPLYSATHLDRAAAGTLAATLNNITPTTNTAASCEPIFDFARYTAIVFAVPGRSDVDVWLKDWYDCPEVGNGRRSSGELNGSGSGFIAQLDADAPPAPAKDVANPP